MRINKDLIEAPNLVDRFNSDDLSTLGELVYTGYQRDDISRSTWLRRNEAGMNLAMQIAKGKNYPWPGCSNVIFPLVTIAALQFSARSYSNIIQGTDVFMFRVPGLDPNGTETARAQRIGRHMSWQVLEEDPSWEEQHDRMLINLSIVGTNFMKTFFSPDVKHNVSELVMAKDLVIDYWAKSVEECARKTQIVPLYRNEIYERAMRGVFAKSILEAPWFSEAPSQLPQGPPAPDTDLRRGTYPSQPDEDTPFQTLEQHRLLDLDQDGYAEPYIVTIEENSKTVLRIVSRLDREDDIERTTAGKIICMRPAEYFTKNSFIPAPDGGIYDVGFGTFLGPINEAVNSGINQMLDAGTMANSNGGFLGRGAKIRGGVYTMAPWEWKRVDSTGDDLRKSMVPLPVREPGNAMFQLISLLINYADRLAGTVDQNVGISPGQNTPAETSRNMTEQGMQVYSTIFKRIWRSMKQEGQKLARLNRTFMNTKVLFSKDAWVLREDYTADLNQVCPACDPKLVSAGMRFNLAAAIRQASHEVPGYNISEVEKNFLRSMGVPNIDQLYPGPDKVPPLPNPKVQLEQLKQQSKETQWKYEMRRFILELQANRDLVQAQVDKFRAETAQIAATIGAERAAHELASFDSAIEAMVKHGDMLNERIKLLSGAEDGKSSESGDKGGGVPAVENGPGNAGVPALPSPMAAGANGAMG